MSLIQAALDKTTQVRKPPAPLRVAPAPVKPSAPKPAASFTPKPVAPPPPKPVQRVRIWPSPVMDEALERELKETQRRYNEKRWFWWKVGAGILLLAVAALLPFLKKSFQNEIPPTFLTTVPEARSTQAPASVAKTVSQVKPIPKPSVPVSFSDPEYRLSGITDLGDGPRAIINNRIVAAGDMVSKKAFVKEIGPGGVLLVVEGKEILLKMQ